MEWSEIAAWLFKGGGALVALYVANEFRKVSDTLKEIGSAINELRVSSAVVVERVTNHERRIERLEDV